MLTKTETRFTVLFVVLVIAELICGSVDSLSQLHYATKPAIVLSLIAFLMVWSNTAASTIKKLTVLALTLSLFGDILLMFVSESPHYFTAGLVSFLLAHVVYIFIFMKHRNPNRKTLGFIIGLLVYASGLFYLLKDGLGAMLIPVIVYMFVILTMSVSAYLRKSMVSSMSYNLVFIGALCFMLSDSILATNKFYEPLPLSNITIMLTYAVAQYLIVMGIIKHLKNHTTS